MIFRKILPIAFAFVLMNCSGAWAAVGTNPASGNPLDYGGAGDWVGSSDPDQLTNDAGATVNGNVYGNLNSPATGYSGGGNTITNAGTVSAGVYGSYNSTDGVSGGGNTIDNSGTVVDMIVGTRNDADNTSGGGNYILNSGNANSSIYGAIYIGDGVKCPGSTVVNTGTVGQDLYGTNGVGTNCTIGYSTIYNYNVVGDDIYGDFANGVGTTGGFNVIYNYGSVGTLTHDSGDILGTRNKDGASGGSNTIYNHGTVTDDVYGSKNEDDGTSGGGNTIENSGTVGDDINGSSNEGENSTGGSNTIINSGTVGGSITGSRNIDDDSSGGDNKITNSGTVVGGLYGSDNQALGSSGSNNTITNTGMADLATGSHNSNDNTSGGGNYIVNSGTLTIGMEGSLNAGDGSSGGSNILINTGTAGALIGSENVGVNSSGGSNTITNSGTVGGALCGSFNSDADVSGGSNTITNSGTVGGALYGSVNSLDNNIGSGNTIDNSGTVGGDLYGSLNGGFNSSGSSNTITNSGTVSGSLYGSFNSGSVLSGGGNTITNSGAVNGLGIFGSFNMADDISGGSNTITNSGSHDIIIIGSENFGDRTTGGSNTITNTGTAQSIVGSDNLGDDSTGGGNTIVNRGSIITDICGSWNSGDNATGGGNTIVNRGNVGGDIYGSLNEGTGTSSGGQGNYIYNSGKVTGGIYAGDADDIVNVQGNSRVGGVVDGQSGTDTLIFGVNGTHDSSEIGSLYLNFENFAYDSSGHTTLTGNWSFDQGAVVRGGSLTIASGAAMTAPYTNNNALLVVNGTLYGSVSNYGTMQGTGTVFGNVTTTGGTMAPGNSIGTLAISGTYTHGSGSMYQCEVAAAGSSDKLCAGKIVIQGGSVRLIMPVGYYADGETWTILSADQGISGQFSNVYSDTFADSVVLELSMEYGRAVANVLLSRESYSDFGADANQHAAGRALDAIRPLADGDMEQFLLALDYEFSAAEIGDLLASCNPEMYDGMTWAALGNARLFDGVMQDRADWGRAAAKLGTDLGSKGGPVNLAAEETGQTIAAEPMQKDWSLWARALGNWQRRIGDSANLGYDASSGGAVLGADGPVLPWLRLGMAFAAGNTDLGFSQAGDSGTQKSMQGGLYATADLGDFYLDAGLSYSTFDNDTERGLAFAGSAATAKASYDSSAWMARLGGGWDMPQGNWLMGPRLDVAYLSLSEDGFRESGADFLSLDVQDRDADYWSTALGLRAAARYDLGGWSLLPRVELAWRHLFDGDARGIAASFRDYAGQGFTAYGQDTVQDELRVQAGVRALLADGFNAFIQLGLGWGDDSNGQDLSLGLNYMF